MKRAQMERSLRVEGRGGAVSDRPVSREPATSASPERTSEISAVSRLAAGNTMRERLKNLAGLGPVSDAAARFFYEFFDADASAISLLRYNQYRTLVTVGDPVPGQTRHPDGETYDADIYPTVTRKLKGGSGYVASIGNDGGIPESQAFLAEYQKGTCIGAPIVYRGDVVGEVFVSRARGRPHYTGRELASALDLARQLGFRIGPAVKAQLSLDPEWWVDPQSAGNDEPKVTDGMVDEDDSR